MKLYQLLIIFVLSSLSSFASESKTKLGDKILPNGMTLKEKYYFFTNQTYGESFAACARDRLKRENSHFSAIPFKTHKREDTHILNGQIDRLASVLDLTAADGSIIQPVKSKDDTYFFPLKNNSEDYHVAVSCFMAPLDYNRCMQKRTRRLIQQNKLDLQQEFLKSKAQNFENIANFRTAIGLNIKDRMCGQCIINKKSNSLDSEINKE